MTVRRSPPLIEFVLSQHWLPFVRLYRVVRAIGNSDEAGDGDDVKVMVSLVFYYLFCVEGE